MLFRSGLLRTTQHEFPVLDADGRLAGFLTRNAIYSAATGDNPQIRVRDAMTRDIPELPLSAPLTDALNALSEGDTPAVAVTDRQGNFLGYITRENIGEMMVLRGRDS